MEVDEETGFVATPGERDVRRDARPALRDEPFEERLRIRPARVGDDHLPVDPAGSGRRSVQSAGTYRASCRTSA